MKRMFALVLMAIFIASGVEATKITWSQADSLNMNAGKRLTVSYTASDTLKAKNGSVIVILSNFSSGAGIQQDFTHVQADTFSSDSVTVNGPVTITGALGGAAGTFTTLKFSGITYGNETANSFMTQGITLNQGANDDEIISLKSSDVLHGMTSVTETDTYIKIAKVFGAGGGLSLRGYLDADISNGRHAVYIEGVAGVATVDSTDNTSSVSVVSFSAQNYDGGTGQATLSAAENAFGWYNDTLLMLLKGGGQLHLVNTTLVALDEWDDRNLIRALERDRSAGVLMTKWDNRVRENKDDLIAAGVLGEDGTMLKVQSYLSLLGGGIWQNATDIFSLQDEVQNLKNDNAVLRQQVDFLHTQMLSEKPLHWGIKK